MKVFVICKTILPRHFFKDVVIIWLGEIFCDAESMDTQHKRNYSCYYCVKTQEKKDIQVQYLIWILNNSFQAPGVFGKINTRIDRIKIIRLCTKHGQSQQSGHQEQLKFELGHWWLFTPLSKNLLHKKSTAIFSRTEFKKNQKKLHQGVIITFP